jgi:hypothetical protein
MADRRHKMGVKVLKDHTILKKLEALEQEVYFLRLDFLKDILVSETEKGKSLFGAVRGKILQMK